MTATTPQQNAAAQAEGAELSELAEQLRAGRLDGLRQYLARTRVEQDWQDRVFVLQELAAKASIDALESACAAEPEAADLRLIRCAYYAELAKTMRGGNTADQVGQARFQNSAECAKAALGEMAKATELDAEDPTAYTIALAPLTIFSQRELQRKLFEKATAIAPDLVEAHFAVTNALTERWGGSHRESLEFARTAVSKAGPGSDMAGCLFWAHALVRTHFRQFDKDERATRLYGQKPEVVEELNAAFDGWLAPPYLARRSSPKYLRHASYWYQVAPDAERLARVIALTGEEIKPRAPGAAAQPAGNAARSSGGLLGWLRGAQNKR
jgi:hypothetical protein